MPFPTIHRSPSVPELEEIAAGLLPCLIRGRDINEAQREVRDGSSALRMSCGSTPMLGKRGFFLEGLCIGEPGAARVMVLGG